VEWVLFRLLGENGCDTHQLDDDMLPLAALSVRRRESAIHSRKLRAGERFVSGELTECISRSPTPGFFQRQVEKKSGN
jgi:hypothetical protein